MTKKKSPAAALKEIDEIVQFWRNDEVDGATYTLLQVDLVLCGYFEREQVNFPEEQQP